MPIAVYSLKRNYISLSHYLANMSCEVPEIKMPFVPCWVKGIDPKCYIFLETFLTGENNRRGNFSSGSESKITKINKVVA